MKEATGELNMTIVTLVAITAVAALLWLVVWPMVQRMLVNSTCKTYGDTYEAVRMDTTLEGASGSDAVATWMCCPGGDSNSDDCFDSEVEAD